MRHTQPKGWAMSRRVNIYYIYNIIKYISHSYRIFREGGNYIFFPPRYHLTGWLGDTAGLIIYSIYIIV